MKKLITAAFLTFCALFNQGVAQIQSIDLADSTYCSDYRGYFFFSVGSLAENNPVFTVNWGDGTSETINGGIYDANNYYWESINHTYTSTGTYNIVVSAVSTVTATTITSNPQMIALDEIGACGSIYPYTQQTTLCGSLYSYNHYSAVYDLTDANGVVQTFQSSLSGVNVNNTPYTLTLNQDWLAENNLVQSSAPIIISSFSSWGNPIVSTNFVVESNTISTTPDYGFSSVWGGGYSSIETAYVYMYIGNYSCVATGDIRVGLTFPSDLVPSIVNLTNPSVVGNVLSFDLNFDPMYYSTGVLLEFSMPGTMQSGTMIDFSAVITDLNGVETNLLNNEISFQGMVWNSYDPNDKLVNKPLNIDPTEQDELVYTINFQNEGNADALKVVVKDTLSENLDLSTFEVITTKHNVVTRIDPNTREVKFTFNDIYLAPKDVNEEASKGYIVYKIKEKANLPVDSEIKNTARIYFDFNPAIITNTTLNRNTLLKVDEIDQHAFVTVYPNPVKNELHLKSAQQIESLAIFSTSGTKVLEQSGSKSVDVSQLANGIYFLELTVDSVKEKMKIVVNQ